MRFSIILISLSFIASTSASADFTKTIKEAYCFDVESDGKLTGYSAFCSKNPSVPKSVTSIGDYAFYKNQLTSVQIPDGITYIGEAAFGYNKLTSVQIPDSVTYIGDYAFWINQLTSVQIPDRVTSIGNWAFFANKLTSVQIPDSVTSIEEYAFCNNELTSVQIPDSVTSIGDGAFEDNQLTSVQIPDSVTTIGTRAFNNNPIKVVYASIGHIDRIKQLYCISNSCDDVEFRVSVDQLKMDSIQSLVENNPESATKVLNKIYEDKMSKQNNTQGAVSE